jgi:MarR family transcriptional regulator for hemolysin
MHMTRMATNSTLTPPEPGRTLGFLLHDAARLLRKRFEQEARRTGLGLTRSQWQVLAHLALNEGIHQSALADLLDVEPITLVRILDKLQALGLVERRPHAKDRRLWVLFLTEAAHPLLDRMRALGHEVREQALAGISEADRVLLLQMLTHIKHNLSAPAETTDREARHG